ncbi:A-kinase anchoring protein 7 isoform X2 [Protopterus annectens]|uniref:A-kinase anchoring protein 7 isoform X2 n=1 Tax=Protopterus annectens TaxID=7888 RepID=UPI001CF9415B|nr:A-kinase anchoring protein 7 isoform X2 [Protopterus annectens]
MRPISPVVCLKYRLSACKQNRELYPIRARVCKQNRGLCSSMENWIWAAVKRWLLCLDQFRILKLKQTCVPAALLESTRLIFRSLCSQHALGIRYISHHHSSGRPWTCVTMSQQFETSLYSTESNDNTNDSSFCNEIVSSLMPDLLLQPPLVKADLFADDKEAETALFTRAEPCGVETTRSTSLLLHSSEMSPPLSAPGQQEELKDCAFTELDVRELFDKGVSVVQENVEVKAVAEEHQKSVRGQSAPDEGVDVLVAELPFADVEDGTELGNFPSDLEDTENKTSRKRHWKKRKKKRSSSSDVCLGSLLTEFPFSTTDIRAEFGISSTNEKSLKKKRKRTAEEGDTDADQKKKKTQQPNYFVSIPITNPKIIGGIQAVQDIILQRDHRLSKAMVTIGSLHITLLVMHLATDKEVKIAASAFEEAKGMVTDALHGKNLILPFKGIGHFRNEVVFANLAHGDHMAPLYNIAEAVKKEFQEKGILSGDTKPFKPHLTFMKLSRAPKLRKQGIKKLDPKLYQNFVTHWFGEEAVNQVDLCSMLKKKQPSGYYHCESSITVGKKCDADSIRKALHREKMTLLIKVAQIKELLSRPETRERIQREMSETRVPKSS